MERSRAAVAVTGGERGGVGVQIPGSGKLIRSAGSRHPELDGSCAGRCRWHSLQHGAAVTFPELQPLGARPARDHLSGAAARGPVAGWARAAQGVTGGPRLSRSGSGRARAPGIAARAFKPAASAVRGAVRACRRRPR